MSEKVFLLPKIHNLEYIQNNNRNISILWNISIYLDYIHNNPVQTQLNVLALWNN